MLKSELPYTQDFFSIKTRRFYLLTTLREDKFEPKSLQPKWEVKPNVLTLIGLQKSQNRMWLKHYVNKHKASESKHVTTHISSSRKFKDTSKPLCKVNCSMLCKYTIYTNGNLNHVLALSLSLLTPFNQICLHKDIRILPY